MPLPKPTKGEIDVDFLKRCIANSTMKKEYPDDNQRVAACNTQFKKGETMEKTDDKGRKIIAENVNIIFTGDILKKEEE